LGLEASERLVNVGQFETVAVSGVFSGGLRATTILASEERRRPVVFQPATAPALVEVAARQDR
jgi:hypothetical protein